MIQEILINQIEVTENHRADVEGPDMAELMQSIKQHGVLEPIRVLRKTKNKFMLIYGERRLTACRKLGNQRIPAEVLHEATKQARAVLQLTENLQRKDPSFAEMGRGIEILEKEGLTLQEISVRLGIRDAKTKLIYETYKQLPAKHRKKVEFAARGTNRVSGTIPPNMANKIIAIKKRFRLGAKEVDQIVDAIVTDRMNGKKLQALAALIKTGAPAAAAMAMIEEVEAFRLDIVLPIDQVERRKKKAGISSAQELLRRIVYGEEPPMKKPKAAAAPSRQRKNKKKTGGAK
jgi:ParB/RepB/Spo0J family partition protein